MRRLVLIALLLAGSTVRAAAPDHLIERALSHLDGERFELARSYLEPVVIDPRLTSAQRSRAYYLRGYSFFAQDLYRSAALDYGRALEFDAGNDAALTALAALHTTGQGVPKDLALAFRFYLRAARIGNVDAKSYVGFALLTGTGTEADVATARFWLTEAKDAGDRAALLNLARSHRAPFTDTPDPAAAVALYESAIELGHADALLALGYMHLDGELGSADPVRAASFFARAADMQLASGQAALGYLYLTGSGVPADNARARSLFELAVEQDFGPAFAGLAYLYQAGLGVRSDAARAEALYSRGAHLNDPTCQLRLAEVLLARGDGVSARSAVKWLAAAAAQGDANARNAVAWILATSKHDDLRDGARAVIEAEAAVAVARSANTLDTLAAAYAEAGRYDEAVATQTLAIAELTDREHLTEQGYDLRLARYQSGAAWRE